MDLECTKMNMIKGGVSTLENSLIFKHNEYLVQYSREGDGSINQGTPFYKRPGGTIKAVKADLSYDSY